MHNSSKKYIILGTGKLCQDVQQTNCSKSNYKRYTCNMLIKLTAGRWHFNAPVNKVKSSVDLQVCYAVLFCYPLSRPNSVKIDNFLISIFWSECLANWTTSLAYKWLRSTFNSSMIEKKEHLLRMLQRGLVYL